MTGARAGRGAGGPFVVLVGGGTGSGKTTIAGALAARHGDALVVACDRYYLDLQGPAEEHDFDRPEALQTALLVEHLLRLGAGEVVDLPRYDFSTHRRMAATDRGLPRPLVIVEGLLVLAVPELCRLAGLRAHVHADADLRLARRLTRDLVERGRDPAGVLAQYLRFVRPAHHRYVEPGRRLADVALDGEGPTGQAVEALLRAIAAAGGPLPR